MTFDGPMLLVIRRPVTPKEWAFSIALLAFVVGVGYKVLNPVVQSVFSTEHRVVRVEDQVGSMNRRLERVEDAVMSQGRGAAQVTSFHMGAKP